MSVKTKLHQTLVGLEGASKNIKSFVIDIKNQQAKQLYAQYANQLDNICKGLSNQISEVEKEEKENNE